MPHRFESLHVSMASVGASFFSGLVVLLNGGPVGSALIDSRVLTFACIVGACGGSLISLIFFPPKVPNARVLAVKFLGSGLAAVIFSPMIIRWMKPEPDFEFVLFVSGAVGLSAFTVITAIRRSVEKRANRLMGGNGEDDEPR